MKTFKILGVISLTSPLITTIACSAFTNETHDFLLDGFEFSLDDNSPDNAKFAEANSKHLNYIYENYVTKNNYLDYDAVDEAGYEGISSNTPGKGFVVKSIEGFGSWLKHPDRFHEEHDVELFKLSTSDVSRHINGEFKNLDIELADETAYGFLEFEGGYINFDNDVSKSFDKWLFRGSENIDGAIIGKEITRIPEKLFTDLTWNDAHPIQFEDPSKIESIGHYAIKTAYPSSLSSYDFTDFTSLNFIGGEALAVHMYGSDENGEQISYVWDETEKSILKLPDHEMTITTDAFNGAPVSEVHYYSEYHKVIDEFGDERMIQDIISTSGITFVDLSKSA